MLGGWWDRLGGKKKRHYFGWHRHTNQRTAFLFISCQGSAILVQPATTMRDSSRLPPKWPLCKRHTHSWRALEKQLWPPHLVSNLPVKIRSIDDTPRSFICYLTETPDTRLNASGHDLVKTLHKARGRGPQSNSNRSNTVVWKQWQVVRRIDKVRSRCSWSLHNRCTLPL